MTNKESTRWYKDYSVYDGKMEVSSEEIQSLFEMAFTSEQLKLVNSLSDQIECLKEKYPILSLVDMVIEGVWGRTTKINERSYKRNFSTGSFRRNGSFQNFRNASLSLNN